MAIQIPSVSVSHCLLVSLSETEVIGIYHSRLQKSVVCDKGRRHKLGFSLHLSGHFNFVGVNSLLLSLFEMVFSQFFLKLLLILFQLTN